MRKPKKKWGEGRGGNGLYMGQERSDFAESGGEGIFRNYTRND